MDAPSNSSSNSEGPQAGSSSPKGRKAGNGSGRGTAYPESVTRLIDELARLPGIGRRSAERLTFHLLKTPAPQALALSQAINDVKQRVKHCRVCYNLMDATPGGEAGGLCSICAAPERDRGMVMVVEQPKDLIALEQTGTYRGLYHILMGRISPLEGVKSGDLTIADLLHRIDDPTANLDTPVREVVLALNPTMEGDGTALYLAQELSSRKVQVSRLARGLPTGSTLEFASKAVLADAIEGRKPM